MIRLEIGAAPGTLRVAGLGGGGRARLPQPGRTLVLTPRQTEDGQLVARLGRLLLPLPRGLDARAGERLTVRVAGTAAEPVLEVIARDHGPDAPAQSAQRRLVPRQQSLASALTTLRVAAEADASETPRPSSPSPAVRRLIIGLLARMPTPDSLSSGAGLRSALRDSGVLLETLLAHHPEHAPQITANDFKANLARIASRLLADRASEGPATSGTKTDAGTASGLTRAVDGALARLGLMQLSNAVHAGRVDMLFALPIATPGREDELSLRIREEERNAGDGAARKNDGAAWDVTLRFRFGESETLDARLRLAGERVSVTWLAEDDALAGRIADALPRLASSLEALGLEVAHVSSRHGRSATPPEPEPARGMIHERA